MRRFGKPTEWDRPAYRAVAARVRNAAPTTTACAATLSTEEAAALDALIAEPNPPPKEAALRNAAGTNAREQAKPCASPTVRRSARLRQRKSRALRAAGWLTLRIRAPEAIAEPLVQSSFLDRLRADDPAAIAEAIEHLLANMVAVEMDEVPSRHA